MIPNWVMATSHQLMEKISSLVPENNRW